MVRVSPIGVSIIVYGWRDAHRSMKIVLTLSKYTCDSPKKKNAYILAYPHVCVFDTMHIAGWHSTTLGSAQTSRRLLRQENVAQHRPVQHTMIPITHRRRSSHILHGQSPHNFYESPNTLVGDPRSRQTLIDKINYCVMNSGRGVLVRGS